MVVDLDKTLKCKENLTFGPMQDVFVIKTFNEFFPKERISAGSLFRKIQWLLFKLSRLTHSTWSARADIHFEGGVGTRQYVGTVELASTRGDVCTIDLGIHNLKQFGHTFQQVVSSFSFHSYLRRQHTSASLLFEFGDCDLIYKTNLACCQQNRIIATYEAIYRKLSFWRKILNAVSFKSRIPQEGIILEVMPSGDVT